MMDNYKIFIGELSLDTFLNIKQFGPRYPSYLEVVEGGQEVAKLLQLDWQVLRSQIVFDLRAVGQTQNRLQDRQDAQTWTAMLNQYFVSMIQMAQLLGQPELVQLILMKAMTAATETMRQIGETFEQRNLQRIIMVEIETLLRQAIGDNEQSPEILKLIDPNRTPLSNTGVEEDNSELGIRAITDFASTISEPRPTRALGEG